MILIRVDFNVEEFSVHEPRLVYHAHTLRLFDEGVIVLSHLGRRHEHRSLKPLVPVLEDLLDRSVHFARRPDEIEPQTINLFENTRLYDAEYAIGGGYPFDRLIELSDFFVLDAFSVAHRGHHSVIGPAARLPAVPGPVFLHDWSLLSGFEPEVFILGGGKPEDILRALPHLDKPVIIGGKLAETYRPAKNQWTVRSAEDLDQALEEVGRCRAFVNGPLNQSGELTNRVIDFFGDNALYGGGSVGRMAIARGKERVILSGKAALYYYAGLSLPALKALNIASK